MAAHMNSTLATAHLATQICELEFTITAGVNALVILVLIPVLDLLVIPLLRNLNLTILRRIGVGASLTFISLLMLLLLEGTGNHSSSEACMFRPDEDEGELGVNAYWVLLPLVTVTVAELLVYIPGFEFICAQSPYNMRGLLIGIFFSIQGTFSLVSVMLQYLFSWHKVYNYKFIEKTGYGCGFWFYFIFTGLSAFGLFLYFLVAYKYRKRQRDDVFNEINMIEEYFTSGLVNTEPWNPWKN